MSATDDVRDRIEEVSNTTAEGQHLVTLAVPPEESIEAARERVEEEHARTEYIDADETSERVTEALERVRRVVDDYDETPENGLVVYAGVVDAETVDYEFDDLPSAVPEQRFERGESFDTAPLGVDADQSTYGLVVVEHGKAILGRFSGDDVEPVEALDSETAEDNPTSGELGDREEVHRDFFEQVAEEAEKAFLGEDADEQRRDEADPGEASIDPVDGLFVGGSDVTASEFLDGDYLDHRLRNRVVTDAVAVGDATEGGLEQLAAEARDHLEEAERENVQDVLDEFFAELDGDEAVAGRDAVDEGLEYEGVATTLAAEERYPWQEAQATVTETGGIEWQPRDFVDDRVRPDIAEHFAATREYPWPEVESFLADRRGAVALDLGCGNGRHAELLADRAGTVVGVDLSRGLLRAARDRATERGFDDSLSLVQGDAARVPLAADAVDLAVYVATLHHLRPRAVLHGVQPLRALPAQRAGRGHGEAQGQGPDAPSERATPPGAGGRGEPLRGPPDLHRPPHAHPPGPRKIPDPD